MRPFRLSVLALFVAVAVVAGACAPSTGGPSTSSGPSASTAAKANYGGTITFALENDVSNLDPMLSSLFVDRNIHYAMYDSLVRVSPKGDILPWLAEKWTPSADGKVMTFNLRQGVKYHDGTPFDAASVKWNIERYKTGKGSARTGDLALVDSVEVVDANTVKFNLKQAYAPLLGALVDRAGMMVSQKVVDAMGADFTLKPFKAGTGPFILTEAVKNDHYTLEKNPDWWGKDGNNKLPYLDKVIVKPILDADVRLTNLRTGNAQILNNINGKDVAAVKADPTLTYLEVGSFAWNSLVPNEAPNFIFNDHRLVKAVAMALDRDEILAKGPAAGVGLVGWGPLSPAHFAYDANFKPWPKADPAGAKALVAEALGAGKKLEFELLVSSGDAGILQLAQLIQSELAKADITANIKTQLFNDIVTLQQAHRHPGMTLVGWSGRLDPDGNTYDFVVTGGAQNDSSYSNAKVDELMKAQRIEADVAKRKQMLIDAQKIYTVDDPSRVWYGFGVSPIITVKALTGMESYPDRIPRFQTAQLAK